MSPSKKELTDAPIHAALGSLIAYLPEYACFWWPPPAPYSLPRSSTRWVAAETWDDIVKHKDCWADVNDWSDNHEAWFRVLTYKPYAACRPETCAFWSCYFHRDPGRSRRVVVLQKILQAALRDSATSRSLAQGQSYPIAE